MSALNFLPGVQVNTLDGGLASKKVPNSKSILIVGTSNKGPAETPYQVIDRAAAASDYGNSGTLVQAMEECAKYGDNIILFRMGTSPATLKGIGAVSGIGTGIDLVLGQRDLTANTRYKVWYNTGVLYLWLDGNLVYANDVTAGVVVDLAESIVSGSATGGLPIGATGGTAKTVAGALSLSTAIALSASGNNTPPIFKTAVTGVGMTGRQTYLAQEKAFDLLSNYPVQQVFVPNAFADNANVAFYVSTDQTTTLNNPATNVDALDWLSTVYDIDRNVTYQWASELLDSNGTSVASATFTGPADRLTQGFSEVNFASQLANFCQKQEAYLGGCMGFIGTKGPLNNKFDLPSIRAWIGYLPTYKNGTDLSGTGTFEAVTPGRGLCGIPYLVGTTAAKLNSLCADAASGHRSQGLFKTNTGQYDGITLFDANQQPIDIGSYIHTVGDYAYLSTGSGTYTGNIAGIVCGFVSQLDEKSSTTNKEMANVTQIYRAGLGQLDSLTFAGVNMLRFISPGRAPVLLHGWTSAAEGSDWHSFLRMRIKSLVLTQLYQAAQKFVGESSNDGMTLQGMNTSLDQRMLLLQKRGYIGTPYKLVISASLAERRIGTVELAVSFKPADELVKVNASVAVTL